MQSAAAAARLSWPLPTWPTAAWQQFHGQSAQRKGKQEFEGKGGHRVWLQLNVLHANAKQGTERERESSRRRLNYSEAGKHRLSCWWGQVNCWRSCQLWRPIGSNGLCNCCASALPCGMRHAANCHVRWPCLAKEVLRVADSNAIASMRRFLGRWPVNSCRFMDSIRVIVAVVEVGVGEGANKACSDIARPFIWLQGAADLYACNYLLPFNSFSSPSAC